MSIRFEQITKRYNGTAVVNDVSLEIAPGEFYVLVGPSGSGKSTLLRAVAGLTGIDHGRISLHGRDVTHVRARDRGVGFVFQHYALFRHMSVGENIEFALRIRGVGAAERRRRRAELLKLIALEGLEDRLPGQLSGGQQQRVAVARALAHEPAVLLLDEPFGALDAKIRVELRESVKVAQRRLGITTILVTHDQEEAFALADRIGVMQGGRLLETGSPEDLYRRPATRFVATFLGAANLLLGDVTPQGLVLGNGVVARHDAMRAPVGERSEVIAVVRPEDIEIGEHPEQLQARAFTRGIVRSASFAGNFERLVIELAADSGLRTAVSGATSSEPGEAQPALQVEVTRTANERGNTRVVPGQAVELGLRRLHVLPTPISSFALVGASADTASLRRSPLVDQLIRSMQARVSESTSQEIESPSAGVPAGVVVLDANTARIPDVIRLAGRGVRRFLLVASGSPLPKRVLVHCETDGARPAALALVASILRHVPAEGTYVQLQDAAAPRGGATASFRRLLDARAELQAVHGLDLRTDLQIGDLDRWIGALAADREPTLVIAGIEGTLSNLEQSLSRHFAPLLAADSACSLLVAYGTHRAATGEDAGTVALSPSQH